VELISEDSEWETKGKMWRERVGKRTERTDNKGYKKEAQEGKEETQQRRKKN